jgi:uncharacterized membrane protein (UPF0127 family)
MKKRKNHLPLYTLSLGFVAPLCILVVYVYFETKDALEAQSLVATSANLLENELIASTQKEEKIIPTEDNAFPETKSMLIGGVAVQASIAKTWPERIKGLSKTLFLPENIVKFFIFESSGFHSIWMKDMNYAIDIIWVNEDSEIVYIVNNATPESYPENFSPDQPAMYVIETVSGFVIANNIKVGDIVKLPDF